LPLQLSSFIGRARELEQTAAALEGARLVTLTGAGGVGKTRLALQVAGQVAPRFGDRAWLCELAPVRDVAAVDDAVATVFSVTAPAGLSTSEALVEFLRAKQLLLVLDNCEHLLEAAAALAGVLQRSCERLVILATSREGLGIEGERLVPVPPLAVPDTDADLTAISQAEAVQLFAERAAAVKPEFAVTAQNAAAVAAAVRRLDGIALAIELAAARIAAMTPAELARRLERSFAVLRAGRRGTLPHHQTLRATIDWSYQLLAEPEQRLLARLAVFAGGCTLDAAETVCSGEGIYPDTVFELLARLVARSLVVTEEHGPETRYRLLETIRQYGEERLTEAGETDRWQARHADYYVGVLQQIRHHDRREEVFWAIRLSAEQDNLLAAWSWAIDTGNIDTAFSILAGFAPSEVSFRYPLLLDGEAALELPGAAAHPGYPLALAVSAMFAAHHGDVTVTEELCRGAAEANERRDSPDWRVEEVICDARSNIAGSCRRVCRRRPPLRAGRRHRADRWRPRRHLPPARHRRGRLPAGRRRAQGGPAGPRGAHAGPAARRSGAHRQRPARRRHDRRRDRPRTGPRLPTRESRAQHGARLSRRLRPGLGRRDRIPPKRSDCHPRARPPCHPRRPTGR
jgi:predicted ATPase